MSSRVLNGVGEWNNLNLNYRINIFSQNYSWFSRGVGGSCEFCDKAHALPTSLCPNISRDFHWWWCVWRGGLFRLQIGVGTPFLCLALKEF